MLSFHLLLLPLQPPDLVLIVLVFVFKGCYLLSEFVDDGLVVGGFVDCMFCDGYEYIEVVFLQHFDLFFEYFDFGAKFGLLFKLWVDGLEGLRTPEFFHPNKYYQVN